jgi:glycogen debranching enzyme
VAYHRWTRRYRTWPDGTYWSTGWGCGMDGLPRLPHGVDPNFEHGGVTWVDATLQALLSARSLLAAQDKVGSTHDLADLQSEARRLQASVDDLWDEQVGAYTDRGPGGASAGVLHVGTYWALLAGAADGGRQARLLTHLTDENALGTPVPVPALSRSHPHFQDDGGYWLGGVWTPTTLMVLDGLHAVGAADLAHALGRRHVEAVARVVADTGTIWENWSPMRPAPGHDARPNFVGWGGASAITVALEHLLGLRPCGDRLTWDVRLLERHGVRRLPVGKATLDLVAAERAHSGAEPQLQARTDAPVTLDLTWRGGRRTVHLTPGADLDEH